MNGLEQLLALHRHSGADCVRLRQLVFFFRPSSTGELEEEGQRSSLHLHARLCGKQHRNILNERAASPYLAEIERR